MHNFPKKMGAKGMYPGSGAVTGGVLSQLEITLYNSTEQPIDFSPGVAVASLHLDGPAKPSWSIAPSSRFENQDQTNPVTGWSYKVGELFHQKVPASTAAAKQCAGEYWDCVAECPEPTPESVQRVVVVGDKLMAVCRCVPKAAGVLREVWQERHVHNLARCKDLCRPTLVST